jgi:hypothetical protein
MRTLLTAVLLLCSIATVANAKHHKHHKPNDDWQYNALVHDFGDVIIAYYGER